MEAMETEEAVIEKIRARRAAGRAKYGETMERTDLSLEDWLRHAQEEAMDLAIYLERARRDVRQAVEMTKKIDPDQYFPEHDPLPDRCLFCGADILIMEDRSPCRAADDSWVSYRCFSSVHRSRSPRVHQSRTCEAQERLRLLSRVAELEAQVAGLRDPETMRANLLRGLVVLPSGYGETGPLEERIKRLEEAGSILWKKATCITVRECYDKEMDEVPVAELPPDTVVFEYDNGDGIPAKAIVELNDAIDGWIQANGKPSPPDPREWFRVVGVRCEAIVLAESAEAARAKAIEIEMVGDWEVLRPVEQCVLRIGPKLPEAFS